ncbi:MAG: SpoIIE family protein phosphatase, partial [Bacillota bacterium]|nr:SpoIIE family protein phosphatase [Bacillota bacterium]
GLDGSMLTIFVRETINSYLLARSKESTKLSPNEIINFLNEKYCQEEFPDDYFICIFIGVLELENMNFCYANAGIQIPPIKATKTGEVELLSCGGMPIISAIDRNLYDFCEESFDFLAGSTILFTTDGLVEEMRDEQMYGRERIKEILAANCHLPSDWIVELINNDFIAFTRGEQLSDDVTYLILQHENEQQQELTLEVASSCDAIDYVKHQILEFIAPYTTEANKLLIGLFELITNAVEHGNKVQQSKKVKVKAVIDGEFILFSIEDEGEGFNWRNKIGKTLDLDCFDERGRGITITGMCFDQFFYNHRGNKAFLVKKINEPQ